MNIDNPLLLSVDTATSCSSVALTRGGVYGGVSIAALSLNSKVTHSRRLLAGIDWLLNENNMCLADIDALAVGLGPGSFTGLRIAMATMKGMAVAMGKPLLGVSTLDALAFNCSGGQALCALIDARKREVYRRWYQPDENTIYRAHGEIAALPPEEMIKEVTGESLFVGDGLLSYGDQLKTVLGKKMVMAPRSLFSPSAEAIGFLCCEQLEAGAIMDIETAVPLYVRSSDAELNLAKKCNS